MCSVQYQVYICISIVCSTETRLKITLGQPLYILVRNACVVSDSTCRDGEYSRWLLDSEYQVCSVQHRNSLEDLFGSTTLHSVVECMCGQ